MGTPRMHDYFSASMNPLCEPAAFYFSQSVPSQSNPGADLRPKTQNSDETRTSRTALVVDDVADVTEMLAVLLSYAGYNVVTAGSAPAALQAAREQQFDVIISDIGMPEMNGYQLAREVRLLPGYGTVPMVAVTGSRNSRSSTAGRSAPSIPAARTRLATLE